MPKHRVNLDVLIRREDLEVTTSNPEKAGGDVPSISLIDLEQGRSTFDVLRKPSRNKSVAHTEKSQIFKGHESSYTNKDGLRKRSEMPNLSFEVPPQLNHYRSHKAGLERRPRHDV